MCGIAGILAKRPYPLLNEQLTRMVGAVAHRGPDGAGHFVENQVAFGHRRLSILDLSDAGAQPMLDPATQRRITYNGEIYNYRELREELRGRGYTFRSDSDTEVILAAYDAWGEQCVTRFNGMWAFAIYDARANRVFCSRDRFGVKPFYYTDQPELFAFGSELRQLLPFLPSITAERSSCHLFLITQVNELDETTFFAGIKRLPGGHSLTYELDTRRYRIHRHYELRRREDVGQLSREAATEQLYDLLRDAVALRLRSDVKVGTCLSGGMDSSSVAALASQLSRGGPFAAITAVSEQASNNEVGFAGEVAAHAKLDWYQVVPTYDDFVSTLPAIVRAQEEPFGGPSLTMQYMVMREARAQHIPVLLDGQGGDELLLGYERYYATYLHHLLRSNGVRFTLAELLRIRRNNSKMSPLAMAKYLFGVTSAPARYAYYKYQHRYLKQLPSLPPYLQALGKAAGNAWDMQELDVTRTNLPILLRYEDKNSMAHSVEARLPFLDYRLVEFALSLPVDYKIHDGWTKWILRQAMRNDLPESIVWRRNKFGFEAPEQLWLPRHDSIMRETAFASPLLREMAAMDRLETLYPKLDYRGRFRLYSLALWEKEFAVSNLA